MAQTIQVITSMNNPEINKTFVAMLETKGGCRVESDDAEFGNPMTSFGELNVFAYPHASISYSRGGYGLAGMLPLMKTVYSEGIVRIAMNRNHVNLNVDGVFKETDEIKQQIADAKAYFAHQGPPELSSTEKMARTAVMTAVGGALGNAVSKDTPTLKEYMASQDEAILIGMHVFVSRFLDDWIAQLPEEEEKPFRLCVKGANLINEAAAELVQMHTPFKGCVITNAAYKKSRETILETANILVFTNHKLSALKGVAEPVTEVDQLHDVKLVRAGNIFCIYREKKKEKIDTDTAMQIAKSIEDYCPMYTALKPAKIRSEIEFILYMKLIINNLNTLVRGDG